MLCYLLILAGLAWERIYGPDRLRDGSTRRWFGTRFALPRATLLVAGLVGLFALQVAIVAFLAQDNAITRGSNLFPLNIVDDRLGAVSSHRSFATSVMLAIVLLQTIALFLLNRRLGSGGPSARAVVTVGTIAMYAIAFAAPALTSADMYSYSGYALLGNRAYTPPAVAFPGQYSAISTWWHIPMEPAPYGPLWIAYNWMLLAWVPSLLWKFIVLRAAAIVWLLVILRCAASQRVRPEVIALLALNPTIAFQFISNGHNDVVGVGLALIALALTRFGPWAQGAFVVAAGLMKLPFLALALAMLRGTLTLRLAVAALSIAVTVIASRLIGGPAYVASLLHHAHTHAGMFSLPHGMLLAYVMVAIGVALTFNRWSVVAPFSFPSLAAAMFPWYVLWGLPYALAGRSLAFFLIALPLAGFLFDPAFETLRLLFSAIFVVCVFAARELFARRNRTRMSRPEVLSGA